MWNPFKKKKPPEVSTVIVKRTSRVFHPALGATLKPKVTLEVRVLKDEDNGEEFVY